MTKPSSRTASPLQATLRARLTSELSAGEIPLWVGQPLPKAHWRTDLVFTLFCAHFTAFFVFLIAAASKFKIPRFEEGWNAFHGFFWGTPFVLAGLWATCAPLRARRLARSTVYAITNRRALTIAGEKTYTVKSYMREDMTIPERRQSPNGSGDLIFFYREKRDSDGDLTEVPEGFIDIPDVKAVEAIFRKQFFASV